MDKNNYSIKLSNLPRICFYCGDPANEREHVFPRSVFGERGFKVWACSECNSIAGGKVFPDIESKSEFIRERLEKKYRKILEIPEFGDEEIEDIGYGLKTAIVGAALKKARIMNRLRWRGNMTTLIIKKYLEDSTVTEDDVRTVFGKHRHILSDMVEF